MKYWYYGTMFLIYNGLFNFALNYADNWELCQKLYSKGEYYMLKTKEYSID